MMETENRGDLIEQVLPGLDPYDDLLHRSLLRATRHIARGLPVSTSMRQQVLDEVWNLWQNPPFGRMRDVINGIFVETTQPDFAEMIAERLIAVAREKYWQGNEIAPVVAKLGKREEAVSILLAVCTREIEDSGDVEDRIQAASLLHDMGETQTAATILLEIVGSRFESSERKEAARLLGRIGKHGPEIPGGLLAVVNDESVEASARVAAAGALANLDELQSVLPVLRVLSTNEKEEGIDRYAAADLLGRLGERDFAVSILRELVRDKRTHAVVVCYAAESLIRLGERSEGMEILVNAARADSACVNCGSAGCGLGRTIVIQQLIDLGETEIVISILMPLLHVAELSPYSRLDAATTLARLGKASEATPVLIELLHHQNTTEHSRRGAMEALGKWGERHEEVLQELLTVAQDTAAKENDRWRAVEALGNFGNRSSLVLETLAEVARSNPDHLVGRSACESLWKLTEENFDPPVT